MSYVASDPHSEGHRRIRGEDRREALLSHARLRGGGLRIGDPRGSDMPFLDRHRSRRRRFPRHVRIDPVLARRFLASIRDARGEVRTPSVFTPHERPEAPLRKPGTEASGAHRARSAKSQGEEDVQTQRSGGQ